MRIFQTSALCFRGGLIVRERSRTRTLFSVKPIDDHHPWFIPLVLKASGLLSFKI
jgi:hypothetical protein